MKANEGYLVWVMGGGKDLGYVGEAGALVGDVAAAWEFPTMTVAKGYVAANGWHYGWNVPAEGEGLAAYAGLNETAAGAAWVAKMKEAA